MPNAQRLPRKYLFQLRQAQDDLRLLAKRTRVVLEQLGHQECPPERLATFLIETESSAYRIALELMELKVTDSCEGCPSAPANTPERIHLLVLANELEHQARLARERATDGNAGKDDATSEQSEVAELLMPVQAGKSPLSKNKPRLPSNGSVS